MRNNKAACLRVALLFRLGKEVLFVLDMQNNITLYSAVDRAGLCSGRSFSAILSSFHFSHETHPSGSDSHGCLTLPFAKNGNEKRAKSLNPTQPTAVIGIIGAYHEDRF